MAVRRHFALRRQGGWSALDAATGGGAPGLRFGGAYRRETQVTTATQIYAVEFELAAAGGADELLVDLTGGTGELDANGTALDLEFVLLIHAEIDDPAAGKSVRVGPLGEANGFVGPFVAAAGGIEVQDADTIPSQSDPWEVDATHKILAVKNVSAVAVTGKLLILGTIPE